MKQTLIVMLATLLAACGGAGKNNSNNLSGSAFLEKAKQSNTVLLDVRTLEELNAGYVAGCQHVDFKSPTFKASLGMLDRSKTFLVFCATGARSGKAADIMRADGFASVYTLAGGLQASPEIVTVAGQPLPDGLSLEEDTDEELPTWKFLRADGYGFAEVQCTAQINDLCLGFDIEFSREEYGRDTVFQNFPEVQDWIITQFNRQNQNQ